MQRLMEQSQWLRKIRSFWQAGGRGKLLAVALVSAWFGIQAAGWTDAPDDAYRASTGDYFLAPGVESPKSMLARAQRIVEGQNFDIRHTLYRYSHFVDRQRRVIYKRRRDILEGGDSLVLFEGGVSSLNGSAL